MGIIKHVSEPLIDSDEPRLFHAATTSTNAARLYGRPEACTSRGSTGAGVTREIAVASAIGETLERYCSAIYDPRELVVSSYERLERSSVAAVAPDRFALYSQAQYEQPDFIFEPFTRCREISWTEGYSLVHQEPVLVPACLTYVPFRYDYPGDLIAFGVSTGLCCRPSVVEAILGGLYEAVERDAIMYMWMNRVPSAQIDHHVGGLLPAILRERFAPSGLRVHIFDISTDLPIPVVFALLIDDRNEGLAVAAGASAHLDSEAAAIKALVEAAQVRRWLKSMAPPHHAYRDDFADVVTFEDHVRLFASLRSVAFLDFLIASPPTASIDAVRTMGATSPKDDLERCVAAIAAKGFDVIVVDLTQADVAELGLRVVKVIVPGLVDINADHNYRPLGAARLYRDHDAPASNDGASRPSNPVPHPFP
jgi:ribosomal protein S12 methylthiotransferase accessory factor